MKKTTLASAWALLLALLITGSAHAITLAPARYEVSVDPGALVTGDMIVINDQQDSRTLYASFENFEAQGDSGTPKFTGGKEGLATWINIQESITLRPGESKNVPFSIRVPAGTEPGGYFGAIFWSSNPPQSGGQVTIGAKVGMLVFLSVKGDVVESAGLNDFKTKDSKFFYKALPVGFEYRFSNEGGDRVKPAGTITIRSLLGWRVAKINANPSDGNVLPHTARKFSPEWKKELGVAEYEQRKETLTYNFFDEVKYQWNNFAVGIFMARMSTTYGLEQQQAKSGLVFFTVFPLELLIVITLILIGGYFIFRTLLKRYNRWIINKARQSTL